MCLRSQGRFRIREILLGVLIGLGMAGVLVMWTHEGVCMRHKSMKRYGAGKTEKFLNDTIRYWQNLCVLYVKCFQSKVFCIKLLYSSLAVRD